MTGLDNDFFTRRLHAWCMAMDRQGNPCVVDSNEHKGRPHRYRHRTDRNGPADVQSRQHAPEAVRRVLDLFSERNMSIDAIANEVGTWNYVVEGIIRAEIDRLRKARPTRRAR